MSSVFHVIAPLANKASDLGFNPSEPSRMFRLPALQVLYVSINAPQVDKHNVFRFFGHEGAPFQRRLILPRFP